MKHVITLAMLCLFSFALMAGSPGSGDVPRAKTLSGSSDPFVLDEAQVYQATERLTTLEQHILQNPGTTLSDLQAAESELIQDLNLDSSGNLDALSAMNAGPLGIPSFLWGFCLGVIGLLIVYLVTEDKEELKKALWGFLAAIAVWTLVYILLYSATF